MQINDLAQLLEQILDENKATDIKVLDVSKLTTLTDRMIIATGRSERHARSLAHKLVDAVREHDIKPIGVEGDGPGQGDWVLVDLADAIVHIFLQDTRDFYNLEALWSPQFRESSGKKNLEEQVI